MEKAEVDLLTNGLRHKGSKACIYKKVSVSSCETPVVRRHDVFPSEAITINMQVEGQGSTIHVPGVTDKHTVQDCGRRTSTVDI